MLDARHSIFVFFFEYIVRWSAAIERTFDRTLQVLDSTQMVVQLRQFLMQYIWQFDFIRQFKSIISSGIKINMLMRSISIQSI